MSDEWNDDTLINAIPKVLIEVVDVVIATSLATAAYVGWRVFKWMNK